MDIIESWFFEKKEDVRIDNLKNAIGYAKVVDGIKKESWGNTKTDYSWTKSQNTTNGLKLKMNIKENRGNNA